MKRKDVCEIAGFPLDPSLPLSLHIQLSPTQQFTFPGNRQLVLLYEGEVERTIRETDELSEFADVQSAEAALRFVRLLTDDRVKYAELHGWEGWEIDPKGAVIGLPGALPAAVVRHLTLSEPSVRAVEGGWEITRLVLKPRHPSEPDVVVQVTERVMRNGEYQKVSEIPKFSGKIDAGQFEVRL